MLLRLVMLKAGCGLDAGASTIEVDGGEVQVAFVESGFEARNFGAEPARHLTVGVNRDADLALLDNGVNFHRAEGGGAESDMHLRGRGGIGSRGRGRWLWGRGRCGVKFLVGARKPGRGIGCHWRREYRNGLSRSGECC